jgi:hypothetical protein
VITIYVESAGDVVSQNFVENLMNIDKFLEAGILGTIGKRIKRDHNVLHGTRDTGRNTGLGDWYL